MSPTDYNIMLIRVAYLETLIQEYGENTTIGTITRSLKSKLKHYDSTHLPKP